MNRGVKIIAAIILMCILPLTALTAHVYYTFGTSNGLVRALDSEKVSEQLYTTSLETAIDDDIVNQLGIGLFVSTQTARSAVSDIITQDYFRYQLLQTIYTVHQVFVNPSVDLSNHKAYIQLEPVKDRLITKFADIIPGTGFSNLEVCTTEQFVELQYLLNLDDISAALGNIPCWPEQILGDLPSGELAELPAALAQAFRLFPSQINVMRLIIPAEYQVHAVDYQNNLLLYTQRFTQEELAAMSTLSTDIGRIPTVLSVIALLIIIGMMLSVGVIGLLVIMYHDKREELVSFFSKVGAGTGAIFALLSSLYFLVTLVVRNSTNELSNTAQALIQEVFHAISAALFFPLLIESFIILLIALAFFFWSKALRK